MLVPIQAPWQSAWETTEQPHMAPPPPPPAISRSASSSSSHQGPPRSTADSASNPSTPATSMSLQQESAATQSKNTKGTRPLIWLKSPNKANAIPTPAATQSHDSSHSSIPVLASGSDPLPYALSSTLDPRPSGLVPLSGAGGGFGVGQLNPGGLPDAYSAPISVLPPISLARPSASSEDTTPDQSSQISRCEP